MREIPQANQTMSQERPYLKMLERMFLDTILVSKAFLVFDSAIGPASEHCYQAQTVVTNHVGFDSNGVALNRSDAYSSLTSAYNDLTACKSAFKTAYDNLQNGLMNASHSVRGVPVFAIPAGV